MTMPDDAPETDNSPSNEADSQQDDTDTQNDPEQNGVANINEQDAFTIALMNMLKKLNPKNKRPSAIMAGMGENSSFNLTDKQIDKLCGLMDTLKGIFDKIAPTFLRPNDIASINDAFDDAKSELKNMKENNTAIDAPPDENQDAAKEIDNAGGMQDAFNSLFNQEDSKNAIEDAGLDNKAISDDMEKATSMAPILGNLFK